MTMVLCDLNEVVTAPEVFKQLQEYFGAGSVTAVKLPVADIAISLPEGLLRVERKTPNDFVSSLADGRLVRQVNGMVKSGAWSAVIITGTINYDEDDYACLDGERTQWHGAAVRAAQRAIIWAGALLEYCPPGFYARTLNELVRFASKPTHAQYKPASRYHKPLVDFFPEDSIRQERIEFLMSLPGVGAKLAESLLDWCGTRDQRQVGTLATALSWVTIFPDMDPSVLPKGWSPRRAANARDFLMGRSEGYMLTSEAIAKPLQQSTEELLLEESMPEEVLDGSQEGT